MVRQHMGCEALPPGRAGIALKVDIWWVLATSQRLQPDVTAGGFCTAVAEEDADPGDEMDGDRDE
jgi:hypothetical protein